MNRLVQKVQLRQELKMTPQMLQSMEILQMNSDELLEYLNKVRQENPLIEHEDTPQLQKELDQLRQKASWLDAGVSGSSLADIPERGAPDRQSESLSTFLHDQLERSHLPQRLLALCKYMADLLDDNGWLAQDDLDNLARLKVPQEMIHQALEQLQLLEPAGVGARDLSECLVLQLARMEQRPEGAIIIARDHLAELGRGHYQAIAKKTGLSLAQVHAAEQAISALDPHPGRAFLHQETVHYVRPDVFIIEQDGELTVVMNEYYLPRITISDYYVRLLKQSGEQETREYLQQKLQQAKWLMQGLERRGSTLRACAQAVLDAQRGFFSGETTELSPMSLSSVAQSLSVHPSTVSRAMRGKNLQCRQGTYPLRYFFNRSVGEEHTSQQAIRQKILTLIRDEPPARPLSDQALCRLLEQQGVQVARRTVAKYREQLGIPSSTIRKHRR